MVKFFRSSPTAGPSSFPIDSPLPPDHPQVPLTSSTDECPVDPSVRSKWLESAQGTPSLHPLRDLPSSPQLEPPRPVSLSQDRVISSIPRSLPPSAPSPPPVGASSEPQATYDEVQQKWVYPSEQQFFNAMQRKNHNPKPDDMKTIVPIHNAVNEKAWEEVLAWEAGTPGSEKCRCGPRLLSFSGRPKDRTPKAWVNTVLGYQPPFDRHDWLIDRCGTTVRYVIDFYSGKTDPRLPQNMAFYLDVRPALDDWVGVETRLRGWWNRSVGYSSKRKT